jgi:CubicO group peptidase (beta-lactamase class C family)
MYNNWGYFLLGHVVMAVTGASTLVEALSLLLFRPLGITRIRGARTRAEDQPADEVRYHPTFFEAGQSVVEPDRPLRASGFGGVWNFERDDSAGGLSGAVIDVARQLAMLDVRSGNPVLQPASITDLFTLAATGGGHGFDSATVIDAARGNFYGMKGGSLPESSQNCVRYQSDDISMVVCWNRHDIGEGMAGDRWWYPDFPAVLDAASAYSWGSSDLFPFFGMPTFASRPGCLLSLFRIGRTPIARTSRSHNGTRGASDWLGGRTPFAFWIEIAGGQVIVHKASGLHEGIDDGSANETEAALA